MSQNHLIYKQIFEVEFPTRQEALDGQHRLSQLSKRGLLNQLQQVFDEMVSPDDHLRIRRLEVDLGELSVDNFEEELAGKLTSQLQDHLRRHAQYARKNRSNGRSKSTLQNNQNAAEVGIASSHQKAKELFTTFIQTGRYPWWAGKTTAASPDQLAGVLLDEKAGEFKTLFVTLYQSEIYSRRLIYQLSDATLEQILLLFAGNRLQGVKARSLVEDFMKLHTNSPMAPLNRANFRLTLWRSVFDTLGWIQKGRDLQSRTSKPKSVSIRPNGEQLSLLTFLVHFLNQLALLSRKSSLKPGRPLTLEKQVRFLNRRVFTSGMINRPLGKLLDSFNQIPPAKQRSLYRDVKPFGMDAATLSRDHPAGFQKEQDQTTDRSPEIDQLEVDNAGLILIAPFLPIFFDALGLLKEKTFTTPQAAEQAALILQYIATGDIEMPEHELILNKILCGIDIDDPLPQQLDIGNLEIDEVNNLLDSVIEHWSALKGTSVRGLRDTFINREGTLAPQQNGWKLYVNRITPDVLIDRLPWSISIIKLPWTNDIINTEW